MRDSESFGYLVRRRRKALDLTQWELARRVGCSEAAIRKIEADERRPSQQLAELLARELDIPDAEKKTFLQLARHISPNHEAASLLRMEGVSNPSSAEHPANNLPAPLTSLIDRKRDIVTVRDLIIRDSVRWVTLIGPPGIGKTRLGIQCGKESQTYFRDGVWFIDLSIIHDVHFVLPAIARALKMFDLPQSAGIEQLIARLKDKNLLLVLDNFEQVQEAAVDIATLLKNCPEIKTLVTSRVTLNIYGEHEYHVPPLAIPPREAAKASDDLMQYEAVELFVTRARLHQINFEISANTADAVVEICTRMGGIPLALELAAASLRRMTLDELVSIFHEEEGRSWLRKIGHLVRDLPPRQQTLENVIAWSYTLLSSKQQAFFRRLGVFANQFDVEAAAFVAGQNTMKVDQVHMELDALTNNSLLQKIQLDNRPHWNMLEIIHEFASMQLSREERTKLETKYADYYSSLLRNASSDPSYANRGLFFQINTENLHQVLRWAVSKGETNLAFSLAIGLCDFWERGGYLREGFDLAGRVLAMPGKIADDLRMELLYKVSTLAWQQHRFDLALLFAEQAMHLRKSSSRNDYYPMLLNHIGRIYIEQGDFEKATEVLRECLEVSQANPSSFNPAVPTTQLGEVALALGDYAEAESLLKNALQNLSAGDERFLPMCLTDLAETAIATGRFTEAHRWLIQAEKPAGHHIRRQLYYLSTLAGFLVLNPKQDPKSLQHAVKIYSALETLKEYSGEMMVPFYVELNKTRFDLLRRRVSDSDWRIAWDAARQWEKETIMTRATKDLFDE